MQRTIPKLYGQMLLLVEKKSLIKTKDKIEYKIEFSGIFPKSLIKIMIKRVIMVLIILNLPMQNISDSFGNFYIEDYLLGSSVTCTLHLISG